MTRYAIHETIRIVQSIATVYYQELRELQDVTV